jgi:zinc ribbon protein
MFCPNCGSENDQQKSYCRHCGLPLAAVRLAVDGRVDEAIKTIEAHRSLRLYRGRMLIGVLLILIAISTIFSAGKFGFSNVQSAAFILIILVLFFMMLVRTGHRVAQLLDTNTKSSALNFSKPITGDATTMRLPEAAPNSIIEQDTLKM